MTLRMESACSLSSTQRMVRFGFILVSEAAYRVSPYARGKSENFLYREFRATRIVKANSSDVKCHRCQWEICAIEKFLQLCMPSFFQQIRALRSQKVTSPRITSTTFPPTRTLTTLSSRRDARTKIRLGR